MKERPGLAHLKNSIEHCVLLIESWYKISLVGLSKATKKELFEWCTNLSPGVAVVAAAVVAAAVAVAVAVVAAAVAVVVVAAAVAVAV